MDKKAFGKRLQKYRELVGYSQEKLAERIGRSSIFISYIERGQKSPSLDTLIRLSNELNISVDILLGKEVNASNLSRLALIEDKIAALPSKEQQKMLEILDSIVEIEMDYNYTNDKA